MNLQEGEHEQRESLCLSRGQSLNVQHPIFLYLQKPNNKLVFFVTIFINILIII